MATRKVLELDVVVDRPVVAIGGTEYELRTAAELTVVDYHRIARFGKEVAAMIGSDDLSDEQIESLQKFLDTMTALVLLAPADVRARLNSDQKLQLLNVFIELAQESKTADPAAGAGEK